MSLRVFSGWPFIEAAVGGVWATVALESGKVGKWLKAAEIVGKRNCPVASVCAFLMFRFCEHCCKLPFCEH